MPVPETGKAGGPSLGRNQRCEVRPAKFDVPVGQPCSCPIRSSVQAPEARMGATELQTVLKIVVGPDATTKRRRLERGEGAVGEESAASLGREKSISRKLPSVRDHLRRWRCSGFLGTPGGLGALLYTGPPSPVPPHPPQPAPT